ncbi:MAG: WD40 repeat domain-containing protein, partial [Anaerolineales bacterium]|nr:WD40 repeat domain-containing protein [Anaerolineales bacterium]
KTFPESDRVHSICISPEGGLIFAGLNRVIHVWDVQSGRCLRTLEGHTYLVQALDLAQDGRTLLSGCMDRTVKLWAINAALGKVEASLAVAGIAAVEKALSGTANYTQALLLARQQADSRNYRQAAIHLRTARSQSGFERDRAALEEWSALYCHLPRGKLSAAWCVHTLQGHEGLVSSVCLSPDGKLGFTGGYDKQIRVWDLDSGRCLRALQGHHNDIKSISISRDGRQLLTGSFDSTIKLWDVERGNCIRTFTGHRDYITSVSWSRDGRFALSCAGSNDPTVRLWDVVSGSCLRVLKGHRGNVNGVSISDDGRFGLSGGDHGILKYWDLSSGACLADWKFEGVKGTIKSVCLGIDNRIALFGSGYSAVLWDLQAGKPLQELAGHDSYVFAVRLSLDGRYAFTGSLDHTMKMWDTQTGACLRTFEGYHSEVNSIAVSMDNALVFTSSGWEKTAKLWFLDWELETPPQSNWAPGAGLYLQAFLNRQRSPAGALPLDRQPGEAEIAAALIRQGRPTWTEADFQDLLKELGYAGYGWLSPQVVRDKLVELGKSAEVKNGS